MCKRSNIGFSVSLLLGRVGVGLLLLICLSACAYQQKAPIDDAYYWPEQSTQITPASPATPASDPIEYINVQDTTVTIRIKR